MHVSDVARKTGDLRGGSISVTLLANGHRLFPLSAGATLVLLGLGIWGRISSFRASDRELSEPVSNTLAG